MGLQGVSYQQLFLQERFSDAYLSICVEEDAASDEDLLPDQQQGVQTRTRSKSAAAVEDGNHEERVRELGRYPVHQLVMCCNNEYFDAQVERWQSNPAAAAAAGKGGSAHSSGSATGRPAKRQRTSSRQEPEPEAPAAPAAAAGRPVFTITIDHPDHEAAVLGVIAAMYGAGQYLDGLSQQHLVQVVVYADRLQVEVATAAAVQRLKAAASSAAGLEADTLQALVDLPAWPACLVQLLPEVVGAKAAYTPGQLPVEQQQLQKVLVATLGNLEEVWRDEQLKGVLLALALPALQLLLSSDHLQVVSEDTVLYTAQRWLAANKAGTSRQRLAEKTAALATLVRFARLSPFQQRAQVSRTDKGPSNIFGKWHAQLPRLLPLLHLANTTAIEPSHLRMVDGVPITWFHPARQLLPAQPLVLTWQVPVGEVCALGQKAAAAAAAGGDHAATLHGPRQGPFMGCSWQMYLKCSKSSDGSIGLLLCSRVVDDLPQGVHMKWRFTGSVKDAAGGELRLGSFTRPSFTSSVKIMGRGQAGHMLRVPAGGCVDESALAAAGWPTAGTLTLEVVLREVV